ncbi:Uncharacterized protein SCF082_LOCUS42766 [Durusdinium trenchii]|uniref:Uncharacterized protein n=1 Tax=Durusdinium trenchii TaxID=1381693 RepID=A0ABP0QQY5_9DINO
MQVSEVTSLTYKGGPSVAIPFNLVLQDPDGRKWLKNRASNATIAKLLLGQSPGFSSLKNPSLSASPQVDAVREKIKKAVLESVGQKDEEGLFEGEDAEESTSNEKNKRRLQHVLEAAPPSVMVTLVGKEVEFLTPKNWKMTDIVLPLEPGPLTVLCDFIMEDVADCFARKKRSYHKSGHYSKKAKGLDDLEDSDAKELPE